MNISGVVLFHPNNSANIHESTGLPMAGVPVILQELTDEREYGSTTACGAVAVTNDAGQFVFTGVPIGCYRLIEAAGYPCGTADCADFSRRYLLTACPADPPISYAPDAPEGANALTSLTPNTLFVQVGMYDVGGLCFVDAPIQIDCLDEDGFVRIGENLISGADNGTFGFFPNGTRVGTSPEKDPYKLEARLRGIRGGVTGGSYFLVNTLSGKDWFRFSDHTAGDETGRMMVVEGRFPGEVFYTEQVDVQPETEYCVSLWVANLNRNVQDTPPSIRLLVQAGDRVLHNCLIPADLEAGEIPCWREIGARFDSGAFSQVCISFLTDAPARIGNQFAVDDISMFRIEEIPIRRLTKTTPSAQAAPGDAVHYRVVFTNEGTRTAEEVCLIDKLPAYTVLITGTIEVDGIMQPDTDLAQGLFIGDVLPGQTVTVSFAARVLHGIENGAYLENTAHIVYAFADAEGMLRTARAQSDGAYTIIAYEEDTDNLGPTGPTGPAGPQGEPGCPAFTEFLQVVTDTASVVGCGCACRLEYTANSCGTFIQHARGQKSVYLDLGTYLINFACSCYQSTDFSGQELKVCLYLNGTPCAGGLIGCDAQKECRVCLGGTCIVQVGENRLNELTLRNVSDVPICCTDISITICKIC